MFVCGCFCGEALYDATVFLKSIKREMCESVINIAVPLTLEPVEVRSSDPHLAGNPVSSVCGLR